MLFFGNIFKKYNLVHTSKENLIFKKSIHSPLIQGELKFPCVTQSSIYKIMKNDVNSQVTFKAKNVVCAMISNTNNNVQMQSVHFGENVIHYNYIIGF